MNLLEAIQGAGESWIRSCADKDYVFSVGARNLFGEGKAQNTGRNISVLTGEWEIVTPEKVLAERKL